MVTLHSNLGRIDISNMRCVCLLRAGLRDYNGQMVSNRAQVNCAMKYVKVYAEL